jgi:hypothetical protein
MLKKKNFARLIPFVAIVLIAAFSTTGCTDTEQPGGTETKQPATTLPLSDIPGKAVYEGMYEYDDFAKPETCGICHQTIYAAWQENLMAKSFVHDWDDVEYFELALPHAMALDEVSGVKSGCISCHGPLAFLSGDIPPARPSANTRVNEGVSCEICHSLTGSTEVKPFNFSAIMDLGGTKYGPRDDSRSSFHATAYSDFTGSPEHCAVCHDEQSPYGAWVKETYREWSDGYYADEGTVCIDCHMEKSSGVAGMGGVHRDDLAVHTFYGPHNSDFIADTIQVTASADRNQVSAGSEITFDVEMFSKECGHYFPSGSGEERMLWMEAWATDSSGERYHIPVNATGFDGEEYTIADSAALAYSDLGEVLGLSNFEGLLRDGLVPDGARIFRRPFFNPHGEMTICQWYTKSNTLVDYRFAPRETKQESYTWQVPQNVAAGKVTIEFNMYFSTVPSSVGDFFELPEHDYAPRPVGSFSVTITVS